MVLRAQNNVRRRIGPNASGAYDNRKRGFAKLELLAPHDY